MGEVVTSTGQNNSPQKGGELLQDATKNVDLGDEASQAPIFEFKSWFELRKMTPGERCAYTIDLRAYYAYKARYIQEHTTTMQHAENIATNSDSIPQKKAA